MRLIRLSLCLAILAKRSSGSAHRRDESEFEFKDLEAGLQQGGYEEGCREEESPTSIAECEALESSYAKPQSATTSLRRIPQVVVEQQALEDVTSFQRTKSIGNWSPNVSRDVSAVIHPVPVRATAFPVANPSENQTRANDESDLDFGNLEAGPERGFREQEIPSSSSSNPERLSAPTTFLRMPAQIPTLVGVAESQPNQVISLQRSKPIGNWSPSVSRDVSAVIYPVPAALPAVQLSEHQIRKDVNKAVHMLIGAVSRDDALLLRSIEARNTPTDTYARVIRSVLVSKRMDLALRFAEAAKETINAHVVDRHFRISDPGSNPLPRLAAFIRGLDTLYFATITHEELNFTLLEDAILKPHIWCGPIFI